MLLLYLQAAAITAWEGAMWPWEDPRSSQDTQVRLLTIFITWPALRFLQSLLDIGTQFRRALRDDGRTLALAVRMALKAVVAAGWVLAFSVLYKEIWNQRSNGSWMSTADPNITRFLYAAAVFILPEVLALVLFIVPWVRNAFEKTN
jgi:callose synthase